MTDADEQFRITVTVSDEESMLELVDCVDDVVDASVIPRRSAELGPRTSSVWIDIRDLTPKQWEALELAVDRGYYEQPRDVDLETLATELSISKSAVSQRLRSAEETLVQAVLERDRAATQEPP